jgi:hypothetical protein
LVKANGQQVRYGRFCVFVQLVEWYDHIASGEFPYLLHLFVDRAKYASPVVI